jgi:methionyl-tRNA formyltransferase
MRFDLFNKKEQELTTQKIAQIRIVFMGTPDFSKIILEGLVSEGYNVVSVFTQPDRPVGRKQEITSSPVKICAMQNGIPVEQPERLDDEAVKAISLLKPDLVIVAAYGEIVPKRILDMPGFGCLNIHTSILPRWRGASPIQNALLAGDEMTGVTIMLMDEALDTGPIISQKNVAISPDDTTASLTEKLSRESVELLLETLPLWIRRKVEPRAQQDDGVTLCQLVEREDGRVFWNSSAETIYNQYRAFTPWPGIFTFWKRGQGEFVRIKLTRVSIQKTNPTSERKLGEVFEAGEKIAVQTGQGLLFIEELRLSGKDSANIRAFLNGQPDFVGSVLG